MRQHDLTVLIEAQLLRVKQELEQARLDAKKLIWLADGQVFLPSTPPVLGDLVRQTNLAFAGQLTPPMASATGGVSWMCSLIQSLAVIEVMQDQRD